MTIRVEGPGDREQIGGVHTVAFGRADEAELIVSLRSEGAVLASFVAEEAGRVVGHVLFSRMFIDAQDRSIAAVALAPLAVRPERQRVGIGGALVRHGLAWLRDSGESIAIVLGHPSYYPRFGFSGGAAERLESPFRKEAFMALELEPGALRGISGRVRYAKAFRL